MRYLVLLLCCVLLDCSPVPETVAPSDGVRIVSLSPLPPISSLASVRGVKLDVMFLLREDGTVADVRITTSSGDAVWDAAAADSMRHWRFAATSPAPIPVDRWIRNTVIVQIREPTVLTLGKLDADSRAAADSLYTLLAGGADFGILAGAADTGTSGRCEWFLGATDIARFPREIREVLRKLPVNGVSPPLRVDSRYAIFKRFEGGPSQVRP